MALNFRLENQSRGDIKVQAQFNSFILDYPCSSQTYCTPYIVTLPPNKYLFEVWGAEGGINGGKGGYSRGRLTLTNETEMYIYIGAKGPGVDKTAKILDFAYNGGGYGASLDPNKSAGSGGGGTDLRVLGNTRFHRILVAGAGGGGTIRYNNSIPDNFIGGYGGGTEGGRSTGDRSVTNGGAQDHPGIGEEQSGGTSLKSHTGFFWLGGFGDEEYAYGTYGGGGGGWFGGAGGKPQSHAGGGGGSGYVLTSNSERPYKYAHNSSYQFYFRKPFTAAGNTDFPSCHFGKTEEGHSGNGCARITVLMFQTCFHLKFIRFYPTIFTYILFLNSEK